MAKCINTVIDWADRKLSGEVGVDIKPKPDELLVNTCKDLFATEEILNKKLNYISESILDIGSDFMTILNSCNSVEHRWDCGQVQLALFTKLDGLRQLLKSYIDEVCSLQVISLNKHRYFNYLNAGVIVRLHNMASIVGRFSDQDPKIFYEDFLNPMTSDQSILLHSLGSIWSFIIQSMKLFESPARHIVYKEQLESEEDDYTFLEDMDFLCGARKHAKIFLMDLICLSWIKFNHLVKLDDLIKTHPLPCLCSSKRLFATLKMALDQKKDNSGGSTSNDNLLHELLTPILDPDSKLLGRTEGLRDLDILPLEPPYELSDSYTRSYFIIWHLYSLSNFMQKQEQKLHLASEYKSLLVACMPILELCLIEVLVHFRDAIEGGADAAAIAELATSKTTPSGITNNPTSRDNNQAQMAANKTRRFSPHQEERFTLIFHMIDHFTETMATDCMPLITILLKFFENNWAQLGSSYFQSNQFRVKSMTLFQLFTKIITESTKIEQKRRACDIHDATDQQLIELSSNEKKVELIWDKVLARIEEPLAGSEAISKIVSPPFGNCAENILNEKT